MLINFNAFLILLEENNKLVLTTDENNKETSFVEKVCKFSNQQEFIDKPESMAQIQMRMIYPFVVLAYS